MLLVTQAVAVGARRAARLLAGAQAPRQRAGRRRLRARLPRLPADPVADAERVPPGRARLPAAAVRDLVPRRGPPAAVRALRGGRGDHEGGGRARRRRARDLVRARPRPALDRRGDRRGRGGGGADRDRGRDPALQPRGHLELLHALQPGRQHAGRDRPHRADRPLEDRHDRLHRPRARLPGAAAAPARRRSRCSRR